MRVIKMPSKFYFFVLICCLFLMPSCGVVSRIFDIGKGSLKTTYRVTRGTIRTSVGTGKLVYKVGGFTFKVVMAPLTWPLTRKEIETIDDLPPKEAIKQGRVKMSPYVVNGVRYVPMSFERARTYKEDGIASWYGEETRQKKGGHMTANGEAFDPQGLSAAHKYLPLPMFVRVTNLRNKKSIIVRVNDRGPFHKDRMIDLSAGAAKRLGFYQEGTARVLVEAVEADG